VILIAALLSAPAACAESAHTLPGGAATVYAGAGLGTFQYGSSGLSRDRQWRARVDLYGAYGLSDRLQLSLDAPLVRNWVQDDPGEGPCPTGAYEGDYCDPVTGAGEAGLHARYRLVQGPPRLVAGLGVRGDPWNAGTRGRWTNAGLGCVSAVASLIAGVDGSAGGVGLGAVANGHYRLTLGRAVDAGLGEVALPADEVSAALEGWAARDALRFGLGLGYVARLWGVEYGDDYVDHYRHVQDRWASLQYRALRGEARASWAIAEAAGLHLAAGRVLIAANGPKDALDVSLGMHRYFSPR